MRSYIYIFTVFCDFVFILIFVKFQLYSRLQATKLEIQDLQEEHVRERQELEQTQNELTRELKLK